MHQVEGAVFDRPGEVEQVVIDVELHLGGDRLAPAPIDTDRPRKLAPAATNVENPATPILLEQGVTATVNVGEESHR